MNADSKRLLLFDAYGTLFDEGKEAIPDIATAISKRYGISAEVILQHWSKRYLAREATFSEHFMTILGANLVSLSETFEVLGLPQEDVREFYELLEQRWAHPKLFADVLPIFNGLNSQYVVAILSNSDEQTLKDAVNSTGLMSHYLLSSERAKVYKPDPKIFAQALRELGVTAENAVYIGNSSVDIAGAKRAGLTMIHLNRHKIDSTAHGYSADFIANSLPEALAAVKTWSE